MPVSRGSRSILFGLLLTACAGIAGASQTSIFNSVRDTPIAHFSQADINLLQKTVFNALDKGADGTAVSWENPATGSGGSITPLAAPQAQKGCRAAQVANHWRSLRNEGSYLFCRNPGSKSQPWKVARPL